MPAHPLSAYTPCVRYNISPPWDCKGSFLQEIPNEQRVPKQAKVLNTHSASMRDVTCAEERALVILHNGRSIVDSLDSLRHQRFREPIASSATHVHPQTIPPTSGAAKYHSMCVCRVGWGIAHRVVNIVMLIGYFLCKMSKNIHDVSPTILTTYVANQS